jgi:DNA-binding MarR family transcriptional regulator
MSSRLPHTSARRAPENLAILLREPFRAGNVLLHRRFAERGHPEIRPAHGEVMQFLDDGGTRVSVLAERAQMAKQSMAELVLHLEQLGYVERVPDPSDRRAKLVRATRLGRELYAIAREVVAEIEADWTRSLGKAKMTQLRRLLVELNAVLDLDSPHG